MDTGEYQQNLDSFNAAKDQLSSLVDQVRELHQGKQDAVDKLGTVLETGGNIGSGIMGVLGTIEQITKGTQLESTITGLKTQISTLKDNLAEGIQKGVDSGITKATEAAKSLTGGNQQLNSMIDNAANSTRSTVTTAVNQASGGDLGGLMETAKGAGASLRTTGQDTFQLVRSSATDAASTLAKTGETAVKTASDIGTNIVRSGTETITGLGNQAAALASSGAARASSTVTGAAKSATRVARRAARQAKQQIEEAQQETKQTLNSGVKQKTPLGEQYGDEDIAAIKRLQAVNQPEQLEAGELDTIKRLEPDLFNQPAGAQQAAGASKIAATNTEPASSLPQSLPESAPAETPNLMPELPDFEGLAEMPISQTFGLVPKATQAVASIAPKLTTVESTLGELAGGTSKAISEGASALTQTTKAFAGTTPSKVLGIANKGMRGDSTLARALKLKLPGEEVKAQASPPKAPEPMPEFNPEALEAKAAQLVTKPATSLTENLPEISMESALETKISPYVPDYYTGKNPVLADYYASGVPKDVLQAEKLTPNVTSSQMAPPQARISAPEPTGQPTVQTPSEISGTPNNPSAQAIPQVKPSAQPEAPVQAPSGQAPAPSGQAPAQASSQAPKAPVSEIEPAPPAPTTTTPAVQATTKVVSSEASTEANVGGNIAKAATGELEGGAEGGPEGLIAGVVLAGITSLIGGLIKQFHQTTPTIPRLANTGASFTPEQAMSGGAAF